MSKFKGEVNQFEKENLTCSATGLFQWCQNQNKESSPNSINSFSDHIKVSKKSEKMKVYQKLSKWFFRMIDEFIILIQLILMGGGQSDISLIGIKKGEGYRIMKVKPNSPLDGKIDVFFDFIIDVIPQQQPERTTQDVLNKPTDYQNKNKSYQNLSSLLSDNQNQTVTLKVVSTKYRNVRNVEILPNQNWNGRDDLSGIQTRVERYDEAFETYCPFTNIRPNSPVKRANIVQGQFIIGCVEFKFHSINNLLDNVYDRYFDKEVLSKVIHFGVYNLVKDELRVLPVQLEKGWGEKGLLGCEFMSGQLNKFPKNLLQAQNQVISQKKRSQESLKVKKQLSECSGASFKLLENLKNQKNRRNKNMKNLKGILEIETNLYQSYQADNLQSKLVQGSLIHNKEYVPFQEFQLLQNRVGNLENMIQSLRGFVVKEAAEEIKQKKEVQIMQ